MNDSNLIFIGTGTSEGIPRVSCLTRSDNFCNVCKDSIIPGSLNRRRNTSILITRKINTTEEINIMIDVGKFFYESAINLFPRYNIKKINSISSIEDGKIDTNIFYNLAYGQWTLDEMRSGEVWRHLKNIQ